jgi:dipeptidyl aminopeptidase/acylaminoacyl peptidase
MFRRIVLAAALAATVSLFGQAPENLVFDQIPPVPAELRESISPYLDSRTATLRDWHPQKREILIATRFGNATQLHQVRTPGGARRQITFFDEPVGPASYRPHKGDIIVFSRDTGGGEFFQIYRYDVATATVQLLTDGKSRNQGVRWSRDGQRISYSSTRRNGRDADIYVVDPADPATTKMVLEVQGGGWLASDWSPDGRQLLVNQYISANESVIHLLDLESGKLSRLTPEERASNTSARFTRDGKSMFLVSNAGSEFNQLVRQELAGGKRTVITGAIPWDVTDYDLSEDGRTIAVLTNEDGIGVLHLFDAATLKAKQAPKIPPGVPSGIDWHSNSEDLGFNLSSAKAPADVFSINVKSGAVQRWTESETGGLDPGRNSESELVRMKSFDGLQISAFVTRPDPKQFPGKRPVMVNIHGGPEGQSRPGFRGWTNYLINELGIAVVYPNVRGSTGYGKTFLDLDNGFKREDSVKDIGTVLDWIATDAGLDSERVAVYGGSYGGYMVLASMVHFSDRLRAGINTVGISNFNTFLKNTQDYRRDLRRVEYGDEREPAMRDFLEKISPLTNASRIRKPLLVIQGLNDPRVPYTEAEQIVRAVRGNEVPVWYLAAKDEGHGFQKKANQEWQAFVITNFVKEHLLK